MTDLPPPLPPEPRRLLVAGDSHGDPTHIRFLVRRAREQGCDAILHLGDFGYWPKRSDFLRFAWIELDENELPLYFVEGNHEDYPRLLGRDYPTIGPFRLIAPPVKTQNAGIWHVPRGARWSWQGIRFLGVGGGYSIDRGLGGRGLDWFPEETLSDEEYDRIIAEPDQVDVCVFHDAPTGAPLPLELYASIDAGWNREQLGRIVDRVRPALILHAHYHVAYEGRYQSEDSDITAAVVGLDSDLNPERSWLVLDLEEARGRLDPWRFGEAASLLPAERPPSSQAGM